MSQKHLVNVPRLIHAAPLRIVSGYNPDLVVTINKLTALRAPDSDRSDP